SEMLSMRGRSLLYTLRVRPSLLGGRLGTSSCGASRGRSPGTVPLTGPATRGLPGLGKSWVPRAELPSPGHPTRRLPHRDRVLVEIILEAVEVALVDELLRGLFDGDLIDLTRGPLFDRIPAAVDLAGLRSHRRIEGMLIGLAVGDALGLPTEYAWTPRRRQEELGTIRDHEHNPAGKRGCVSDDTQRSFWTLQRLLARGRLDLDDLARCFVERLDRIVGIGGTVAHGLSEQARRLETGSPPRHRCPGPGRGDGTLMR